MPGQVLSCGNAPARSCPRINAPGQVLSPYQRPRPGPVPVSTPPARSCLPSGASAFPARRAPAFTVVPPGLSRPALPAARYPSRRFSSRWLPASREGRCDLPDRHRRGPVV